MIPIDNLIVNQKVPGGTKKERIISETAIHNIARNTRGRSNTSYQVSSTNVKKVEFEADTISNSDIYDIYEPLSKSEMT